MLDLSFEVCFALLFDIAQFAQAFLSELRKEFNTIYDDNRVASVTVRLYFLA